MTITVHSLKKLAKLWMLFFVLAITFIVIHFSSLNNSRSSRHKVKLKHINQRGCLYQEVDPFDPVMMEYVRKKPPINCVHGLPSLVYLDGDMLRINTTKVRRTVRKVDFCRYASVKLSDIDDSHLTPLKWSKWFKTHPVQLLTTDEHLMIECYLNDILVGVTYKSRIVEKIEVEKRRLADYMRHVKEHAPLETMNVLILGMDGMSKQNFIRSMPKTRDFIVTRLKAREIKKFNNVGGRTFTNVVVLHSGLHLEELPKRWNPNVYFDRIEDIFVWYHYQKAGYRTAMGMDVTNITAYHYLYKGWEHPTFDYYIRPTMLQISNDREDGKIGISTDCVADEPAVNLIFDYIYQLSSTFNNNKSKPYFGYFFLSHLTHNDQNDASKADNLYFEFFQQIERKNMLENTLVIFLSDHGGRFGLPRLTYNGQIEVNTPFVFFIFPSWFEKKYPKIMETFTQNQNRLTTFFDINKTLMNLLTFDGKTRKGDKTSRAISLFDEIPEDRTCLQADIPNKFCNCRVSANQNVPVQASRDMVVEFMKFIQEKTKHHRNVCSFLSLKSTVSVIAKHDEYVEDSLSYWVIIIARPGNGIFETKMEYDPDTRLALIDGGVTRLDRYKSKANCMKDKFLKPYCICKK